MHDRHMTTSPPTDPIFVVGFPRSGTTLLQGLLGAHPRIAAPPEMHFARRIVQFHDYWGDLKDDDVLRRVVDATLKLPALSASGFDLDRVYERTRQGPRTYAGVLDAVMRDFAERNGKQRWSEKTPHQGSLAIWLHFPEARIVHIVRDPRPTVVSNLAKLGGWPDLLSTARAWRGFTLRNIAAGADRGAAHYLRIRYEDLAREPAAVMRVVFAFLGEDFDAAALDDPDRRRASIAPGAAPWQTRVLEPIRAAEETDWRTQISPPARARLTAAVADLMPPLGYAAPARSSVGVGDVLNLAFYPVLGGRALKAKVRNQGSTPQQRYQAEQAEHQQRARRMRRALQRSSKRSASQG
jgi:Sulfotransferase family